MKNILSVISVIALLMVGMMTRISAETSYDYTLLIYMNGSDLESDYHAASDDLLEMIDADIPDNIAVIIQTGGTSKWHSNQYGLPMISNTKVQRWRLTDESIELLENVGDVNMGDAETLSDFINFGQSSYVSDQYALIMWNHGAGAIYGYGVDELHDFDTMTLDELQTAFEQSAKEDFKKFDLIGFDACLMGSVEVGHVLAPYGDYLLASEALEPGHGWNYQPMLNQIGEHNDISPIKLGGVIIDGFVAQAKNEGTEEATTLSLVDLSKIDEVVEALEGLLARGIEGLEGDAKEALLNARLDAESYGEGSTGSGELIPDSDMVDISDYALLIKALYPSHAEALIQAVTNAVVKNTTSSFKPKASGLSMYIPARDKVTMVEAADSIEAIGMSKIYNEFIRITATTILENNVSLNIATGTTSIDSNNLSEVDMTLINNSIEGDNQYYYAQIDPKDLESINEIFSVMGRIDEVNDLQYLARDLIYDEAINDKGQIIGETLDYWVKVNGFDVAMYYESYDKSGIMTYVIPIQLNEEDADLIVLFNRANPRGHILGARRVDKDHLNVQNRNLIQLEPEDRIDFLFEYDLFDSASEGYYYDGWYFLGNTTVGDGLELSWAPLSDGEYGYCFELVDVYGEHIYTDWISYSYYSNASESDAIDEVIWDALGNNLTQGADSTNLTQLYPWLKESVIPPSEWAIPYINTAYNNELLIEGTLDHFGDAITREVFCELVVNMYEKLAETSIVVEDRNVFTDTNNSDIIKAYQLGIVDGYGDGNFGPEDLITREALMTMLYRTIVILEPSFQEEQYPELDFEDVFALSEWAVEASNMLVYYELINGVGLNRLAPKDDATIQESIKLLNGVYEFYLIQR